MGTTILMAIFLPLMWLANIRLDLLTRILPNFFESTLRNPGWGKTTTEYKYMQIMYRIPGMQQYTNY